MITRLRGLAAEIAEVIGEDCALFLFQKRGGTDLKIPETARGSKLADLIGIEAAEARLDLSLRRSRSGGLGRGPGGA